MELKFVDYTFEPIIKRSSDGKKASGGLFFPWSSKTVQADGSIVLKAKPRPSVFAEWDKFKTERVATLTPGFGERPLLGPKGWQDKKAIFETIRETQSALETYYKTKSEDDLTQLWRELAEVNERKNTLLYTVSIIGGYAPYEFVLFWPDIYFEGDPAHSIPGGSVHATNRLNHVGGNIYVKDYPSCQTANWYGQAKDARITEAGWLFDTLPDKRM